jgi:hypothetical protein
MTGAFKMEVLKRRGFWKYLTHVGGKTTCWTKEINDQESFDITLNPDKTMEVRRIFDNGTMMETEAIVVNKTKDLDPALDEVLNMTLMEI